MDAKALKRIERWFKSHKWRPFEFQREVWRKYLAGESGLIHASTGTGKTYAAWLGPILEWLIENPAFKKSTRPKPTPLRVLWITPLRALATDTLEALRLPLAELEIPWTLEKRTSDTTSAVRKKQQSRLPTALITTPESLSLFLTRPEAVELFADLRMIVVDEWHELLAGKRGVQTELGLARLRQWRPNLRVWGLSATMGNLDVALATLVRGPGTIVAGNLPKKIRIDTLFPETLDRFPWGGHLGLKLLSQVIEAIDKAGSSIVFTNTRSQTEIWYQAILTARPDWAGRMALHHGSLDRKVRDWVEDQMRAGGLKCVVSTSSLDLGVDFAPVDLVLQVGSPKGVARLLQRAGRSGHRPGVESRLLFVPTNAWELVEVAAARDAVAAMKIEGRTPLSKPLDVLAQHMVTIAIGGGFESEQLKAEVRTTAAYADLSDLEWKWTLDFVTRGGNALQGYPEYRKVVFEEGKYQVTDTRVARQHRMSIGTIVGDTSISVRYLTGGRLGNMEESFIARLNPGDRFVFAGKVLELVLVRNLTAFVRKSKGKGIVPIWAGGRLPFSTELAAAVRLKLTEARDGQFIGPEMEHVRPVLDLQRSWSKIPAANELLIERIKTRDGHHLFIHPFEGRMVHEGLAAILAFRLSRLQPLTFSIAINDNGFELLSSEPAPLEEALNLDLFNVERLAEDILGSLNASELARRQFRDIARVAGLVVAGLPGRQKPMRQIQASTDLFFEVFTKYDPENLLLHQANREVLEKQLEHTRLADTMRRLAKSRVLIVDVPSPTPLSFPLLVERFRQKMTSEKLPDRIRKMTLVLERRADER